jgi:hypothetical protein
MGHQKQRVAIARAMIRSQGTKILLLDEVGGLVMLSFIELCSRPVRWIPSLRLL